MANSAFMNLTVTGLLDRETLLVSGEDVGRLQVGEEVYVLGIGGRVPGTTTPLIVPKAILEVTVQAGSYVLAAAKKEEVDRSSLLGAFGSLAVSKYRRPSLRVGERELLGNPASEPIRVGDPVIRIHELPEYVKARKVEQEPQSK